MKKRLLSGMRPTGSLHLGHLVGAMENWVKLQEKYECFYMIADWHAFMSEYENPKALEKNSIEMLADWKAASERHEDGDIRVSIEKNTDRFHLDPHETLVQILHNTANDLGWIKEDLKGKENG